MTPKEKANDLIENMKWYGEMSDEDCFYDFAKQCALIAVDEILNNDNNFFNTYSQNDYWLQVKQEINKL